MSAHKPKLPPCLRCRERKHVIVVGRNYRCTRCGIEFDDDPHEGGTCSADPARRLEREEAARERKLDRLGRRNGKPA